MLFQVLCFGKQYDPTAPTKQNLLCNHQSPLEVILSHPDFRGEPEDAAKNFTSKIRDPASFQIEGADRGEFRPPSFTYVIMDR